jgi:isocitrate/isopropylmalate dehydrogenase
MMLDTLGKTKAAAHLDTAIAKVITKMKSQAAAQMGFGTSEIGDLIVTELKNQHVSIKN